MSKKHKLKAQSTVWKKIRRLDISEDTKQYLRDLWHEAKALGQRLVEWLYNRREFCTTVMLGVALAYLVNPLPVLGPILSTLSISLSVLYGIGLQFKADLDRHFRVIIEGQRL